MKKTILLFSLILFAVSLMAQERTVDLGNGNLIDITKTKVVAYNGGTSDRLLATTRDTIDYFVKVSNYGSGPLHFYAVITLDTIAGVDTTVAITVQQKKFANESYADIIASALTSVVSAEQKVVKTSLGVTTLFTGTTAAATDTYLDMAAANSDTINVAARTYTQLANTSLYYSYLKFRLIIKGNDSVGTGIRVKRVELQFFQ
jgi:hypothetical protein